MNNYKLLGWDSKVFNFNVAAIVPRNLDEQSLENILDDLNKQNVRLVYWAPNTDDEISCGAAESLGGFKTGIKRTYIADLTILEPHLKIKSMNVMNNKLEVSKAELVNLTLERAFHSRFYRDPRIEKRHYKAVITKWITDSVDNHTIFVINDQQKIIGFVSLNQKNDIGNIDFIVVAESHSGKGIGKELLFHAHHWFISNGYKFVQAITQKENISACNMYDKFGYYIKEEQTFYHFWL